MSHVSPLFHPRVFPRVFPLSFPRSFPLSFPLSPVLLLDTRHGVAAAKSASAEAKKTMQDVQRHFGEGKVQVVWSDGVVFGPQFDLQGSTAEIRKQLPLLVVVKTQVRC